MMLDRNCRFPNTDPHQLWILLAGRKLSFQEWKYWTRVLFGGRKWFFLIGTITTMIFATNMVQSLTMGFDWYEIVITAVVLLAVLVFLVLSFIRLLCSPMKQSVAAYEEYAADVASDATRIALYGDYIKMVTKRRQVMIRYDEVTVYRETECGFLLGDGDRWIVIRAQDLTPYLADILRAYFTERIEARVRSVNGAAKATLQHPLAPIPYFDEVKPFATATVPWKATPMGQAAKKQRATLWQFAVMMGLYLGIGLAMWVPISPWYLVDLAGYLVGLAVIALGFTGLLIWRCTDRIKPKTADVAFEPDGLRITVGEESRFFIKERLWIEEKADGVQIRFTNKDTLFVAQTTEPEQK